MRKKSKNSCKQFMGWRHGRICRETGVFTYKWCNIVWAKIWSGAGNAQDTIKTPKTNPHSTLKKSFIAWWEVKRPRSPGPLLRSTPGESSSTHDHCEHWETAKKQKNFSESWNKEEAVPYLDTSTIQNGAFDVVSLDVMDDSLLTKEIPGLSAHVSHHSPTRALHAKLLTVAHIKSVCTLIYKRTSRNCHLNNFSCNNCPIY